MTVQNDCVKHTVHRIKRGVNRFVYSFKNILQFISLYKYYYFSNDKVSPILVVVDVVPMDIVPVACSNFKFALDRPIFKSESTPDIALSSCVCSASAIIFCCQFDIPSSSSLLPANDCDKFV